MVKTLSDLYSQIRQVLLQQEEANEASWLTRNILGHVTGFSQEQIVTKSDTLVSEEACTLAEQLAHRILQGEPLAYVLGEWEFYGNKLTVNPHVLIPRDDTCAVTELAIKKLKKSSQCTRVLDLCTGSGCIGLAIASRVKFAEVTLADISLDALNVAKKNANDLNLAERVSCVCVNALEETPGSLGEFDLIISNPPYITTDEMGQLPDSVSNFEPHLALHGGADGLDFYHAITKNFRAVLKDGGYLCFEFGMNQGDDVCEILTSNGFTILERSRDFNDRERAVLARYNRKDA